MSGSIEKRIKQMQEEDRRKRELVKLERQRQEEEAAREAAALKAGEGRQERIKREAEARLQKEEANRLAQLTANERNELDSYSSTLLLQELRNKLWKKGEITDYVHELSPNRFAVGTQLMHERQWTNLYQKWGGWGEGANASGYWYTSEESLIVIHRLAVEIQTGSHDLVVVSDFGSSRLVGADRHENRHQISHEEFPAYEQKMEQLEIALADDSVKRFKLLQPTPKPWYKKLADKLR